MSFGKSLKVLAECLKVEKLLLSKSIFYVKNQFMKAENDVFNNIKVGETRTIDIINRQGKIFHP